MFQKDYFIKTNSNILHNKNLREPQVGAYVEAYNHFVMEKNTSHAIIILPTGVGKTGLMSILPYNISQGRVLIITPQLTIRDTILDSINPEDYNNFLSASNVIDDPNKLPSLSVYNGNDSKKDVMEASNIVLTNIQKLERRHQSSIINNYSRDFFDMILIDEGHHSEARSWVDVINHFENAKVIKLTATPYRTDEIQLTGKEIYKYKLSQAMSDGYVKSLEKFNYIPEKLYLFKENDPKKYTVEEILEDLEYDEDWVARTVTYSDDCKKQVIEKSVEILNNKLENSSVPHKIVAAAPNILEAKKIAAMYNEIDDIRAIAVSHDMDDRNKAFRDIENHRYNVIVNVNLLGEGYDHKYLSVAAIFKVYKSILPYEQFIGRILRTIPKEEDSNYNDNIGSVVVHENLNLDDLWEYYRKEIQESDIINVLREDLENEEDGQNEDIDSTSTNIIDVDFGLAFEDGTGKLSREVYNDTEYLRKAEEENKKLQEKIKIISETLGVSDEEAKSIVTSSVTENRIKRPDLIYEQKRKTTDKNIKEQIVPKLLLENGFDQDDNDLINTSIFSREYSWIAKNNRNNAAMLVIYFNTYLKNKIGNKREHWSSDDYKRAATFLEQQVEYVDAIMRREQDE